ncbi:GxxExxY protein [Candidatus Cloacimonadaceae bacterium]
MERDNEVSINNLSHEVIGSCIDVHKVLGPGMLESVYLDLLCFDLDLKGIAYEREKELSLIYKGRNFNTILRADLVVENSLIVELKSVQEMHPIYEAQIMTYMKLTNIEVGLLINFNVPILKDGIHRYRLNHGRT